MQAQTLQAEVREKSGKGPARQLRMRGLIPAIYYGPGIDPVKLTVSPVELTTMLTGEWGRNQLISLAVGSENKLALVRDLEIDPVTRNLLHADFYSVAEDRIVEALVPLRTVGRSIGVHMGGSIRKYFRELPVRALPQNVPASIVIDVSELDLGAEVTVQDLVLEEGVEVAYAPERRVLFVDFKEKKIEEEEPEAAKV